MSPKPRFDAFWMARTDGYATAANRWATSHVAAGTAYLSARLGLTPNRLSVMSFLCGLFGFLVAFGLPLDRPGLAIPIIVIIAELTLVLDCADGILARVSGQATPCGGLIDHTLDIASQSCALAAFFVYGYRSLLAHQDPELAHAALIIGFLFLVARTTRHIAIHISAFLFGSRLPSGQARASGLNRLLNNLLEYQASMVAALAFLVSPLASLILFGAQALLCAAAVARRLRFAIIQQRNESVS